MAAKDFFVHRHQDTIIEEDPLDVSKPSPRAAYHATIHIDQAEGVRSSVSLRALLDPSLARAILEAVGLDPRMVFAGDLPELDP
jgi:hypothetical protein